MGSHSAYCVIIKSHHRAQYKVSRNLAQTHHCLSKAGPLKWHEKVMASPSGFCFKVDPCNLSILSWKIPWEGTLGKQFVSLLTKTGSLEVCGSSTSLRLPSNCWETCQIWRFLWAVNCMWFFPWHLHLRQMKSLGFYSQVRMLRTFLYRVCLKLIKIVESLCIWPRKQDTLHYCLLNKWERLKDWCMLSKVLCILSTFSPCPHSLEVGLGSSVSATW